MRKLLVSFILSIAFLAAVKAQDKLALAWKADHGFKPTLYKYWEDYGSFFLGISEKEISVIGEDGKSLWKLNFLQKFGFKEAKGGWYYGNGVVEVTFKPADKKSSVEPVILLDVQTGSELWRTGNDEAKFNELVNKPSTIPFLDNSIPFASHPLRKIYGTKIRKDINVVTADYGTFVVYRPAQPFRWGKEVKSNIYVPENESVVSMSYNRKLLRAATGKKTAITVSATKNGNQLWSTQIEARIVSTVVSDEDMIDFFVSQNKVIVVYEGISVLDLTTGKPLWSTEFNNSEVSVGLSVKQELSIADMPIVTNDGMYVVDLSSETYGIKKCDLETGKVIWKSPKYSSSDVIPFITIQNGVVLAKFGGIVNVQKVVKNANTGAETYISEYKMRGKPGVKALDSKTGALLWDEKQLGDKIDFISDLIQEEGKVSFFSDKAFYTIDLKTGKMVQKTPMNELNVDKSIGVWTSEDGKFAYAVYDNGIFAVNLETGKGQYELKVNDINGLFKRGDNYFLQIGENKDKLVVFDLKEGKLKGKIEAYKGNVTEDGKYIILIDWGAIEKYSVK